MILVPHDELGTVWGDVRGWLEAAIAAGQGDENIVDVALALHLCRYELWYESGKFAAVSEVVAHPRQTVVTILYAGGEIESLAEGFEAAKVLAKARGATQLRVWGREGWEKVFGMKRIGVILQVGV